MFQGVGGGQLDSPIVARSTVGGRLWAVDCGRSTVGGRLWAAWQPVPLFSFCPYVKIKKRGVEGYTPPPETCTNSPSCTLARRWRVSRNG